MILGPAKIAIAAAFAAAAPLTRAAAIAAGPLPQSEYADTEASTNIHFSASRPRGQVLSFQIDMFATPSNNVEAAIGRDIDGDGTLSLAETGLRVGWDCGRWVVAGPGREECLYADGLAEGGTVHFSWKLFETDGRAWKMTASENGRELAFSPSGGARSWMFDLSWDLVRFSVRGVDSAGEICKARLSANGTRVRIR